MARGIFGGAFKGLDGFGKTMEDVKVKTRTGAFLTMLSAAIIFTLTIMEFIDYRRVVLDTSILVDRSRGEKLTVKMNVTFPRVPCYLLSLDVTDISGEILQDLTHNMVKTRIDSHGQIIRDGFHNNELDNDVEKTIKARPNGYCGSCYGGEPPEGGCCQTCESVRQAYLNRGWSFGDPDAIEQCAAEHWTAKIHEQNSEGCSIAGRVRVNKVTGNFHFSPGRSFVANRGHVQDLVPYLKDGNHHDFGHYIHEFRFEGDTEAEDEWRGTDRGTAWRKKVGIEANPLDDVMAHVSDSRTEASNYMFQYFMKVVSTEFKHIHGDIIRSHQYSVTSYERDLTHGDGAERDSHGTLTGHGVQGLPGAFFNFEISPMMVVHRETRATFAHFATSLCAIVGGVLTLASILDSVMFATMGRTEGSGGFGAPNGKLM
ncbi:endoplasmic reticulum-derived transport vesicle ERV46 [Ceratobasidium sp. AG-I]|nr:endoplasmic reticulum-derived transport vesicle ERV46 [Ceratobasidium sp. AG-I]